METIKQKIKDTGYRNWVKSTLGLEQTSRAVYEYVKEKFILYTHGDAQGLKPEEDYVISDQDLSHIFGSGSCIRHDLIKKVEYDKRSNTYKWKNTKPKTCDHCDKSFKKILSLRNETACLKLHIENSDDTRKIPLEWAIAKMFMPEGNKNNKGPEETDPYAIFHIMGACLLFRNAIRGNKPRKLKDTRNKLYHSSNNAVSDQDVLTYFQCMKDLLEDASNDDCVDQAVRDVINEDIEKLKKLEGSEMTVSLFDDALKLKRKALYYDFEKSLCENDPDTLKELLELAEQTVEDIQELKKHAHEVKYIEKYKSVLEICRQETEYLSTELTEMKDDLRLRVIPDINHRFQMLRESVGDWRQALRFDISRLEVDGILIVIVVTIFLTLLLRVCVYFA